MKQGLLGTALAAVCATAMVTAQGQTQTQPQQAQRDQDQKQMVTVVGCLHPESQVPGRDQTVFQRWGITSEDFLVVQAEIREGHQAAGMQPGQQPGQPGQPGQQPGQPGQQPGQPGHQPGQHDQPVGTAGYTGAGAELMPAFKIEGLDADKLRQYQGQRVQIQGRLEKADHDRYRGVGMDRDRTGVGTDRTGATPTGTGAQQQERTQERAQQRRPVPDQLPTLHATSIQRAEGTCPAPTGGR